jgi:hypothetical protein
MPNEVGANLQKAQDDIQRTSGNPLFITRTEDATGGGRRQILDRNSKVRSQNVPAGTSVDQSVDIVLGGVKLTESCPRPSLSTPLSRAVGAHDWANGLDAVDDTQADHVGSWDASTPQRPGRQYPDPISQYLHRIRVISRFGSPTWA